MTNITVITKKTGERAKVEDVRNCPIKFQLIVNGFYDSSECLPLDIHIWHNDNEAVMKSENAGALMHEAEINRSGFALPPFDINLIVTTQNPSDEFARETKRSFKGTVFFAGKCSQNKPVSLTEEQIKWIMAHTKVFEYADVPTEIKYELSSDQNKKASFL